MLWSNAPEFCLLCSICKPQNLTFLFPYSTQLNHKIMSISSLYLFIFQMLCNFVFLVSQFLQSSTHLATQICTCINSLNSFLLHLYKFCRLCWQFVPIMLALCSMLLLPIMLIIMYNRLKPSCQLLATCKLCCCNAMADTVHCCMHMLQQQHSCMPPYQKLWKSQLR